MPDCKTYNCAGSAFQTYQMERFAEVWNLSEYGKLEKLHEEHEKIRDAFAAELAAYVAKLFSKTYIPIVNVNTSFPVGSVVMRIRDNYVLGTDFHFIRKVDFDGETCWLSKAGTTPEDIWFDTDVNSESWENGYDSQMYLFI